MMNHSFLNSAAADSTTSTLLSDIETEIDCSQPNLITVSYPDIKQSYEITTPIELLLNCSNDGFQVSTIIIILYPTYDIDQSAASVHMWYCTVDR